ncbi:MAG: TIGR00730 family Rossman fold protein [Clostridiales bacterium]|nr:TIGR00730 family Rossman fold protein [Clostridiales bacterium]
MNIAVYCASSGGNDDVYRRFAYDLGTEIGKRGHTLVYGGSKGGLMGAVADGCLDAGGKVIGVEPDVPLIRARQHPRLTEVIFTDSMAERKTKMIELSDGFIALPGGPGTLDEITEAIDLKKLHLVRGGIVLADVNGFWQPLRQMLHHMNSCTFLDAPIENDALFSDDIPAILNYLEENYEV